MAKSSRSSTNKENNRRKAASVFGPAELARQERLSAKLLELAKQPKPEPAEVAMDTSNDDAAPEPDKDDGADADDTAMDIDSGKPSKARVGKRRVGKRRVDKRKHGKSSIVFAKYSDRLAARKKKRNKGSQ